ncbi:Dna damage-binding protein cmr1 [Thalictrum thalictroides]|uniref:Dna damage-binding protein cmr1 n=1 Tax=Thalictrum thalictroides TaxID=46969 RepID=A0A7J6VD56_THATH|nr:Dna damage-binding protein cmr1 [Thalictrum thalictroides]
MEFADEVLKEADQYNGFNLVLTSKKRTMEFADEVLKEADQYNGFNLVLTATFLANPVFQSQRLGQNVKELMDKHSKDEIPVKLITEELMTDTTKADKNRLPGSRSFEWEYKASSIFIDQFDTSMTDNANFDYKRLIFCVRLRPEGVHLSGFRASFVLLLDKATEQQNETKILKTTRTKKLKSEFPIILRRSPRTHGVVEVEPEPEPEPSSQEVTEDESIESETSPRKLGPLTMEEAYNGDSSDRPFINTIMSMSNAASSSCSEKRELVGNVESFDPKSMVLKPENIGRVMPDKISNFKFFPCPDRTIVASGNSAGEIAFWDVDCEDEDCDGIYLYQPHESSISGISIQPFSLSKVFSSCYGGLIRVMDVGRESFDLVYSTDISIFCLSQQPNDSNTLYFGQGSGLLSVFDARVGKSSDSRRLHELRINTLDFNPENINLVATSSTDGTACIWDVRYINSQKPKYLKMVEHTKSVHSAYFSPSGKFLATTSIDDKIGILGGVDFMDTSTIYHLNRNAAGVSYFRAIWGWDDSYLFIGNLNGGVDVISTVDQSMVTLESSHISAAPLRFAAHPYKIGTLAAGTSCRKIYVWT